jgi:hypothetical protein
MFNYQRLNNQYQENKVYSVVEAVSQHKVNFLIESGRQIHGQNI